MDGRELEILIVDDEKSIRNLLGKLLTRHGYRTLEASNGREALELFSERDPDIVIADIRMPEMNGLELLRAIKKRAPEACVAIMTGYGTEKVAIDAIRNGASNYFKKPFHASEIIYAVGALAELIRHRERQEFDYSLLTRETKDIVLENDFEYIYKVIMELTRTVACHPFDVESVKIGLLEMLTNAIEHGNLKVSVDEKHSALQEGTLERLYRERSDSPAGRGKKVEVHYDFSREKVLYTIRDDGEGFDWRNLPPSDDPQNIMSSSGRGIIMTRLLMDEVSYNESGNAVTLVKFPRASPG